VTLASGATGMDLDSWHGAVQRLLAITLFVPIAVLTLAADSRRDDAGQVPLLVHVAPVIVSRVDGPE